MRAASRARLTIHSSGRLRRGLIPALGVPIVVTRALPIIACVFVAVCSASQEQQRIVVANEYLSSRNDLSSEFREAIHRGQVLIGMSLEEASAAGGSNIFSIDRDRAVWTKEETDPWQIIAAQRLHPDDSKISLHFQNVTQFGTADRIQFSVVFARGRAVSIERGWRFQTPAGHP